MSLLDRAVVFQAQPWPDDLGDSWDSLTERAAKVADEAGIGDLLPELMAEARARAEVGDGEGLRERVTDRRFARALLQVWSDDPVLAKASMLPEVFDRLGTDARPGRHSTVVLVALLWRHFDLLDDVRDGLFGAVRGAVERCVQHVLNQGAGNQVADPLSYIAQAPHLTLVEGAPGAFAAYAVEQGVPLDQLVEDAGLRSLLSPSGRFAQLAYHAYYLGEIARADHTRDKHAFLGDVADSAVKAVQGDGVPRLGHELLTALCDKPSVPSARWLEAILEMAGDPRQRTSKWDQWWRYVPERLVERASRWMVGEDLRTWLKAIEAHARENNQDQDRMFTRRRTLLTGLYEQGRIQEVRLVLGYGVRESVRKRLGGLRIDAARMDRERDLAVIIVFGDGFQIVEGTHNFKMYLYAGSPTPTLKNPGKRVYTRDEFRHNVPAEFARQGGLDRDRAEIAHQGFWQPNALRFLKQHGVAIDPATVLDSPDLRRYHREFWRH
ncbi:EH signature domain-containing protein [Promicromonospora sp. NFX87]|uniref:EH signature domain-containing protein n=1 Tax=Promicromonospora sp. NFX87 TaxID=3402691 RepID=UPI003AFB4624